MGEKALWPTVIAILGLFTAISVMMVMHVDVMGVVLVFSLMGNIASGIISVMLYGKVNKVESNTNGNMKAQQDMIKDLFEYVKNSAPLDSK